ncbi:YetF domain-containing protein [Tissierella simiarum]|uniref:YetF domain-containing protein n=1 Tax=Tissierella simiarum TaxID=2841534 RepID=UPI001FEA2D33|nr:DUF421 domain-containing protein [Tissierella simiarum]
MVKILQTIIRTTLIFTVLLLLTRLLGKKQLSQLTYFNYITGTTIGSIAANISDKVGEPFLYELINLAWWIGLTFLISFISLKWSKGRVIIDGEPTIVIKKGKISEKALSSLKLNIDDLMVLLRSKNVFSIKEVEYAILEPNGEISILKNPDDQNLMRKDLNIQNHKPKYIPMEIITDGYLIEKNLQELNLSKDWVIQQLAQRGIYSFKDVLFAEIQEDGTLYIEKKIN